MELTGYNGILFSTLGITSAAIADPSSPGPQRSVSSFPRAGNAPYVAAVMQDTQVITAQFTARGVGSTFQTQIVNLLGVLNPDDPYPKTLTANINISGTTAVQTQALVGQWRYTTVNTIQVDFIVTTPGWVATTISTLFTGGTITADGSFVNANAGYRETQPTLSVWWVISGANRGSPATTDIGWKSRYETTITNNGTEPIINQPWQLGPFDTAALVAAGTMLVGGGDLRVYCDGRELRRDLINPNSTLTFIWVVLPDLMPGQSAVLQVATNNGFANTNGYPFSSQTSPLRPAMDISGDDVQVTSSTATSATATGNAWETNQWTGGTYLDPDGQMRRVLSNTTVTINVNRAFSNNPGAGDNATVIKSGLMGDGGTISSGGTTTITDSSQSWNDNEWTGATAHILSGTGAGTKRTVVSNTATTLTLSSSIGSAAAATYRVYRYNGVRMWDVRQVQKGVSFKGLWAVNRSQTVPSQVSFDAPGSWYRFTYLRNEDAYSQPRYRAVDVGGGDIDYFPVMYIQRARKGKGGAQQEVGVADSIGHAVPYPILGIDAGWTIRSARIKGTTGSGMCEMRGMYQEIGGENWGSFFSDPGPHDSSTNQVNTYFNLTGYGSPNRVAWTLIPNGSDEVPSNEGNTAQLVSYGEYVKLAVNPVGTLTDSTDWLTGITFTAVYDWYLIVRNGGASGTTPYERIVIGGPGRKLLTANHSERIVIDTERHRVYLTNASAVFQRYIDWAAFAQRVVTGPTGTATPTVSARWLPIPSQFINAANIYYSDPSGAPWGGITMLAEGRKGYIT